MSIFDKNRGDVCFNEFSVPYIDRKNKKYKNSDIENFAISMWKTRYPKHRKYHNLWMNNKVKDDKMQFVNIFFHICWISAENLHF